jgi:uncharacterized membrane protein
MKNKIILSGVCIVLGIALLVVSIFTPNALVEKWSSFALGLSFPLFVYGITTLAKTLKPQLIRIKK